ncbi:MAG: serine protease [Myxococcales bacterium]|nr:serine protease [Myxococcales bacterium]
MARLLMMLTLFLAGPVYAFSLPGQPPAQPPKAPSEQKKRPELSPEELQKKLAAGAEAAREKQASWAATDGALPQRDEARGSIYRLELKGGITQSTSEYVLQGIQKAKERRAEALVIVLDTPGGLLQATREMVSAFLASPVPIIVWVGPGGARAGSAGVFITVAAHVAAMAPGTNIGAAHPVSGMGGDIEGEMDRKVTNDTAAWARSIATLRGRNAAWADQAVRSSDSIPETEAEKLAVIDLVVSSETQLMQQLHGRVVEVEGERYRLVTKGVPVETIEMTGAQKLVQFLANPNLAYILFLVGMFGIFLEFKVPGLIIPGVVGAVCLALVLGVQVMPVNWFAVLLIVLACVCFVAEIYVTSFGALTALGVFCLVSGSYLLFDVPGSDFRVDHGLIWGAAAGFTLLAVSIGTLLMRSFRQAPLSGREAMAGLVVDVYRAIPAGGEGKVIMQGTFWNAVSDLPAPAGSQVRVVEMDGLTARVQPIEGSPAETEGAEEEALASPLDESNTETESETES